VNDAAMEEQAKKLLKEAGAKGEIHFHHFPTNDAWCRDHGAIILLKGDASPGDNTRLATDWDYNAWGNKYPPHDLDNLIPARMAGELGIPVVKGGMILEGGSIECNGDGVILTSESCLLNPNRNPTLMREEIEQRMIDFLGIEKILWLGDGIVGDDTDGHVDDMTRFVAPNVVLTAIEENKADENHEPLDENLCRLKSMTDRHGKPFEIVTLPMPRPVIYAEQRLPASYANFYIGNRVVLMPGYGGPNDDRARSILKEVFPARDIVDIDCTDLIWGLGAFHCLTQQVPAGR
jgi:agmatine deiminase